MSRTTPRPMRLAGISDCSTVVESSQLRVQPFFFQAEDGIRDLTVTGVQTCALPISGGASVTVGSAGFGETVQVGVSSVMGPCLFAILRDGSGSLTSLKRIGSGQYPHAQIGRASCRERG